MRRKLQEMVLAVQIEKAFTKPEILGFYCNQVYMGHGRYGIEAASEYSFGKTASMMTLPEAALLAGLVQRPEAYSPFRSPEKARSRRDHVLNRMAEEGKISRDVADQGMATPVEVAKLPEEDNIAPYFVEEVRRYLDSKYGEVALYEEGMEVHTTLDPAMQKAANHAVFEGLRVLDKRQGLRPIKQNVLKDGGDLATFTSAAWSKAPSVGKLRTGVVTEVNRRTVTVKLGDFTAHFGPEGIDWTGKTIPNQVLKVGDVSPFLVLGIDEGKRELRVKLDQEPLVEGALMAIDPASGEIKALVGGYDFNRSEFDRSMQSYRQAGSAFKPFVYTTALDSGHTLADTVFDRPTVFVDKKTGDEYQPDNYYRKYYGVTTLRQAMEESRNIVAVKLLNQIGYSRTIETARKMGISSRLEPYPSMALGTEEVSLIDLTTAYSIFPNQGVRVEPHFIRYVADRDGKMREESKPQVIEVLRADIAYVPIDRNTGLRATVESNCPVTFLEAFLAGTEPAKACSAVEHFRQSLPYYLQSFEVTNDLELSLDGDALVHLVSEGQGEVEMQSGGKEILVHFDGKDLQVPLDISRSERHGAVDTLATPGGGPAVDPRPSPSPGPGTEAPTHFGVDGRPAETIYINND